jgi:transcription elongation factor/antiterminator RfaH
MSWYAIHTHPKQEARADSNLQAWGVETFSPKLRECRYNEFTGAPTFIPQFLFPRYIFARFQADRLFHKVKHTRGVFDVVSIGDCPARVDDDVIELIKSQVGDDGYIYFNDHPEIGDTVVIKNGPLRSFTGIFERRMHGSERVMILLNSISFQGRICVDINLLEKV